MQTVAAFAVVRRDQQSCDGLQLAKVHGQNQRDDLIGQAEELVEQDVRDTIRGSGCDCSGCWLLLVRLLATHAFSRVSRDDRFLVLRFVITGR